MHGSADFVPRPAAPSARTSPAWSTRWAKGCTRFRPGDAVYGDNLSLMGGFAEYVITPESVLVHKPAELTFAQASTLPQAGAIALRGTEKTVAGSRVLINGAGGGREPSPSSSPSSAALT